VLAQSVPNIGNYRDLDGTFRVGIQVTNQLNGFSQQAAFGRDRIEDIEEFIDPDEIEEMVGTQNARFGAITTVFDLRGATAIAAFAQNGTSSP
jgi:hypothetical protein